MGGSEEKLVNYLMRHRHGSPFEHSYFTFRVKLPIFVAREWMRHRIGSFNEMSGRYVEFEPEFYIPDKWRIPAESNKQGSVFPDEAQLMFDEIIKDVPPNAWSVERWNKYHSDRINTLYENLHKEYRWMLRLGIAKEMARMILPVGLYTEFYWTVNARSLMNFLNLRLGDDAQWEIREYAFAVQKFFLNKMPITHKAWLENDRLAP